MNRLDKPDCDLPPVFIVGAPRTGSTLLYQYLTNCFDFLYINNLACKFTDHFLFGLWLSQKFYGAKAHDSFNSDFGSTSGWNSPSECGKFWYQWLPRDRHFIDFDEITPELLQDIRGAVSVPSHVFKKPFLFKNLNAGQRIRLISKALDDARFIFLKRDPFFTVQSIIGAKRKLNLDLSEFWSIMPSNFEYLSTLPWHRQIVGQVYSLERQIHHDLQQYCSPSDQNTLHFETLNVGTINRDLEEWLPANRGKCNQPSISTANRVSLERSEVDLVKTEIERWNWETYDESFR